MAINDQNAVMLEALILSYIKVAQVPPGDISCLPAKGPSKPTQPFRNKQTDWQICSPLDKGRRP